MNTNKQLSKVNILLILIIGLGAVIRLVYMLLPESRLTPDEATYGLSALHILKGEWPIFYYAQPYTGTFSAYLSAILIYFFGPNPLCLKIVPYIFSVGFIYLNYRLAKSVFKEEGIGRLAAFFTALAPAFLENWSSRAGTGYTEALFFGNLLLILAIRLIYEGLSPKKPKKLYFLFGFLAGLGFWIQPAIIYYLLPAAIFLFLWRPSIIFSKDFLCLVAGALIGGAPVIYYNLSYDWLTQRTLMHKPGGIKASFVDFFFEGLPRIIGTRPSYAKMDIFPPLAFGVYLIYLLSFAALIKDRFWHLSHLFTGRFFAGGRLRFSLDNSSPADLLILFFILLPVIFSLSPFNWFLEEPRYIQPLYSFLPLILSFFVFRLWRRLRPAGIIVGAVILMNNISSLVVPLPYARPETFLDQYNLDKVIRFLTEREINFVNTGTDLAHRLVYESGEKVIAIPMQKDFTALRYPAYLNHVENAPKIRRGFVFIKGQNSIQTETCKEDLRNQDGPCHEYLVDNKFLVYTFR